jgi:Post-segregation antitoxin CcdA
MTRVRAEPGLPQRRVEPSGKQFHSGGRRAQQAGRPDVNQMTRGTKVQVAMSLDAEVVRETRALTSDIGGTVEKLLMEFIARERSKRDLDQRSLDAEIAWLNEIHDGYGLPGAEFSPV